MKSHLLTTTTTLTALAATSLALPQPNTLPHPKTLAERASLLTTTNPSNRTLDEIISSWDLTNLTLAAVRIPPVNWPLPMMNKDWDGVKLDLNGTVDLGIRLIEKAAAEKARVIHFPEVWFPGYPKGVINSETPNPWFEYHVKDYIENSLVVGSTNWNKLVQAAIDNSIYVGLSFSEKDTAHLYMAQSLISPDGEILIHRHKLRPSAQERDLWTDGKLDQIYAVSTPIGRIGMLSCGEHTSPEVTFLMQAQTEDIHLGSWPLTPDFGNETLTYESAEVITSLGRVYAILGDSIVVQASIGTATIFPAGSSAVWSQTVANVSFEEFPLVYRSFNATAFTNTTYNADGEVSWGTLQAVNQGFPEYIPQVQGGLVPWHEDFLGGLVGEEVD
ncbi:aliphatic nitrilase [Aspergillus sclerotiicarbonarius CBS 121057]|uniref:nitrilase n=1 Tax=Aspergillus sclerotiicarbonarius (strain CBS 121057 / IBT 28362) TaxID=1448318 RepID=A0A319E6T3_ASPSB|nr:aliphatic nitrilase [Aspergillus sclerotiicarbonarius CBS 121057]